MKSPCPARDGAPGDPCTYKKGLCVFCGASKPMSKAAKERLSDAISASYSRQARGRQILLTNLGPFWSAVETRIAAGEEIDAAVAAEIPAWTVAA